MGIFYATFNTKMAGLWKLDALKLPSCLGLNGDKLMCFIYARSSPKVMSVIYFTVNIAEYW